MVSDDQFTMVERLSRTHVSSGAEARTAAEHNSSRCTLSRRSIVTVRGVAGSPFLKCTSFVFSSFSPAPTRNNDVSASTTHETDGPERNESSRNSKHCHTSVLSRHSECYQSGAYPKRGGRPLLLLNNNNNDNNDNDTTNKEIIEKYVDVLPRPGTVNFAIFFRAFPSTIIWWLYLSLCMPCILLYQNARQKIGETPGYLRRRDRAKSPLNPPPRPWEHRRRRCLWTLTPRPPPLQRPAEADAVAR